MHDTDIALLKVFIAVVQSKSFSGAQAILNIAPSTISEHMTRLETRLGFRLCFRGRGGFRLTSQGKAVYESSQRLMAAIEMFNHETGELKNLLSGEFRLGLLGNTITDQNSPVRLALDAFNSREGDVTLRMEIGSPIELEQQLLDGRLHIGVGTFPVKISGLEYYSLYEEHEGLYCGEKHPLFSKQDLTLEDISQYDLAARGYMKAKDIELLGSKVATATVENVEAQAFLILTGKYIGILPNHYASPWVEKGELQRLLPDTISPCSSFEYVVRQSKISSYVVNAFIDDLLQAAQNIQH
ncbi:LysR family transcriptional regulator [Amphritea sp. HPY]|uniref:LysR family transcriptional regulator n=1 Tax=Amphritea sp. HPY TaxID=3421652 RepID=UPI003D7D0DD2